MDTLEELEEQLQNALTHLHDRDYQPSQKLYAATGCDLEDGAIPVLSAIIREIENLAPDPDIPPGVYARRVYDVLRYRYVLKLTQEKTAERLDLSVRHLARVQRDAVHTLARILWERSQAQVRSTDARRREDRDAPPEGESLVAQTLDWRSQTQRELASLRASAPDTVSDVGETINGVLRLMHSTNATVAVRVEVEYVQPDLVAMVHPSVLRQVLIAVLGRLAQHSSTGQVKIYANLEDGNVRITIRSVAAVDDGLAEDDLIGDIPMPEDVSVETSIDGSNVFVWVEAPSTGGVSVLVIDDNPDIVRLYRRSTLGTRYHIIHTAQGQDLFETVRKTAPDIIVLDIMLPDVDGWELLTYLHQDLTTRSIPVIVCSVVREESLALSLGAALYLSKPVRPREFIRALDRILPQVSADAPTSLARTQSAC